MTENDLQKLDSSNPTPNTNETNVTKRPYESHDDEQIIASGNKRTKISEFPGVNMVLEKLGLRLKEEWLHSCLTELQVSVPGFRAMDDSAKAKLCFNKFLMSDMTTCGAGVLPPDLQGFDQDVYIKGPFVLQVNNIENIFVSKDRMYRDDPSGTGRCLMLSMTDGVQSVYAYEFKPIEDLQVDAPLGLKVSISRIIIRKGNWFLFPEYLDDLGGCAQKLDAPPKSLVNKHNRVHVKGRILLKPTEEQLAEWNDARSAIVSTTPQKASYLGSAPVIPGHDMSTVLATRNNAQHNMSSVPLPHEPVDYQDTNYNYKFEEYWAKHFNTTIKGGNEETASVSPRSPGYPGTPGYEMYCQLPHDEVLYYGYEESLKEEIFSEEDGAKSYESEKDEDQPDEKDKNRRVGEPHQTQEIQTEAISNREDDNPPQSMLVQAYKNNGHYPTDFWSFRPRVNNYYNKGKYGYVDYDFELYLAEGSILKWVAREDVARLIRNQFKEFFLTKFDLKMQDYEYKLKIKNMISAKKCTLEVDFEEFIGFEPAIGLWLQYATKRVLDVMNELVSHFVILRDPRYRKVYRNIYVRLSNLLHSRKIKELHELRFEDFDNMVCTTGVVTRRSKLLDDWKLVKYDCTNCNSTIGPCTMDQFLDMQAHKFPCYFCYSEKPTIKHNKDQSTSRKYRLLTISETASSTKMDVVLFDDLVDCASRGEHIKVIGIYSSYGETINEYNTNSHGKKRLIEAHYVEKLSQYTKC